MHVILVEAPMLGDLAAACEYHPGIDLKEDGRRSWVKKRAVERVD